MTTVRYVYSGISPSGNEREFPKQTFFSPYTSISHEFFNLTLRVAFPDSYFICGHSVSPPGHFSDTPPSGLKFHYVAKGHGFYNGKEFTANSIFFTHPESRKVLINDPDTPREIFWCVWRGEIAALVSSKLERYNFDNVYCLDESIQPQNLFRYMIYQQHHKKNIDKTISAFSEMLLAECQAIDPNPAMAAENRHSETIHRIQHFIKQNFKTTSVDEIARIFHYNRRYLSSIYHAYAGVTIQDTIKNAKLHCAEQHLVRRQLTMKEIALASGYDDYSTFVKAFKKKYAMTPSEYAQFYSDQ